VQRHCTNIAHRRQKLGTQSQKNKIGFIFYKNGIDLLCLLKIPELMHIIYHIPKYLNLIFYFVEIFVINKTVTFLLLSHMQCALEVL
jgi:hypothetical protein